MRYVAKEVSTKRGGVDFKFQVEVPQYDSREEFEQAAGGADNGLKYINGSVATSSVNAARAVARNAKAESPEAQVLAESRDAARTYSPTGAERGPSQKALLNESRSIAARIKAGEEVSAEELAAWAAKFGA